MTDLDKDFWDQLERNTLVQYEWADILTDPTGSPEFARLARRTSLGFFWEVKDDDGIEVAVFALMLDKGSREQSGWDCVPIACIESVEILKRPAKKASPRKRQKAAEEQANGTDSGSDHAGPANGTARRQWTH